MLIRQIRNATLAIDYAGVHLLTDPWLMDKGMGMLATSPWPENNMRRSSLVDLPCSVEEVVAGVRAVLVTHVHPDHFEADTVWYDEVAKTLERYRPEVTVLNCCGATLASRGASSWTRRTCLPCARRRHGRRWWPSPRSSEPWERLACVPPYLCGPTRRGRAGAHTRRR